MKNRKSPNRGLTYTFMRSFSTAEWVFTLDYRYLYFLGYVFFTVKVFLGGLQLQKCNVTLFCYSVGQSSAALIISYYPVLINILEWYMVCFLTKQ